MLAFPQSHRLHEPPGPTPCQRADRRTRNAHPARKTAVPARVNSRLQWTDEDREQWQCGNHHGHVQYQPAPRSAGAKAGKKRTATKRAPVRDWQASIDPRTIPPNRPATTTAAGIRKRARNTFATICSLIFPCDSWKSEPRTTTPPKNFPALTGQESGPLARDRVISGPGPEQRLGKRWDGSPRRPAAQ